MKHFLKYYAETGILTEFDKYTIDTNGRVRNKKSDKILSTRKIGKYNVVTVYENSGKKRSIRICRALASTFIGPPPTPKHTADHKDRNRNNDVLENIRWATVSEQNNNRNMSKTQKFAFIIVKDGEEKTSNEWVDHLKDQKNSFGREYTAAMINMYAIRKQYGFSYKEYPDLEGEVWKEIAGSRTIRGLWKISNMNRVKYITNNGENVLSGDRIGIENGYPAIRINGKQQRCHILSFMTFFSKEYAAKKSDEMILHENDDKLDFRPQKLRLGTMSDNGKDAHDNGKYDGKKSMRMKCASYIDGVFEKEHESQNDAARYLKSIGYEKTSQGRISDAINGNRDIAYRRTWTSV